MKLIFKPSSKNSYYHNVYKRQNQVGTLERTGGRVQFVSKIVHKSYLDPNPCMTAEELMQIIEKIKLLEKK
jgi:hypothetical protein